MRAITSVAVAALFFAGIASARAITQDEAAPYLHAQRLVDVGGHSLNLYCTGRGSPTVILDAGQTDTTIAWRKVQPTIATFTRVCSYDRAGSGFSSAGPLPRDASAMVHDAHAMLASANIAPPYVLVGHSIAGLYALLYADRFPQQVAGMVLVDPSFPNQTEALHAVSPAMKQMEAGAASADTFCYDAAVHHRLGIDRGADAYALCGFPAHTASDLQSACAKNGTAWCALHRLALAHYVSPEFWAAYRSEDLASYGVDSAEITKEQRSYGAMPLTVLTAANDLGDAPLPAAQMRAIDRVVTAGHDRLARLSRVGTNVVVRQSEHDIELDRPSVVAGAIAEVVSQARR